MRCACWALRGNLLVTGAEDCTLIAWDCEAVAPQLVIKEVHDHIIVSLCSHPQDPVVVTGSEDGSLVVTDIVNGMTVATLMGHLDSVESVGTFVSHYRLTEFYFEVNIEIRLQFWEKGFLSVFLWPQGFSSPTKSWPVFAGIGKLRWNCQHLGCGDLCPPPHLGHGRQHSPGFQVRKGSFDTSCFGM